jgi:hypothetical protein
MQAKITIEMLVDDGRDADPVGDQAKMYEWEDAMRGYYPNPPANVPIQQTIVTIQKTVRNF